MKIGLFSDVHGHLTELERTLDLFVTLSVSRMICLGDLVDKGQQSDAVVAKMADRDIPCVMGNHDAKAQYTWLRYNEPLTDRTLSYLAKLPQTLAFKWLGVSIACCHANPWHDSSVYIHPEQPTELFDFVIRASDAQVIVMGHTHHPMWITRQARTLINPGSVYRNRDCEARTCAVLTLPDVTVEFYDIDTGHIVDLPRITVDRP